MGGALLPRGGVLAAADVDAERVEMGYQRLLWVQRRGPGAEAANVRGDNIPNAPHPARAWPVGIVERVVELPARQPVRLGKLRQSGLYRSLTD
jgi:hypothetical protein